MATIQVRIDDDIKTEADNLFSSLGLDTSTAIRIFISASIDNRGIPFEIRKKRQRIDVNDGFGSYVCEYGYFHDYSKLSRKLDEAEKETIGPFETLEDLMRSLNDD